MLLVSEIRIQMFDSEKLDLTWNFQWVHFWSVSLFSSLASGLSTRTRFWRTVSRHQGIIFLHGLGFRIVSPVYIMTYIIHFIKVILKKLVTYTSIDPSGNMLIYILEINFHVNAPLNAYMHKFALKFICACLPACEHTSTFCICFWVFVVHQPMAGQTVALNCAALSDQNHDIICFRNLWECSLWCCALSITGHQFLLKRC